MADGRPDDDGPPLAQPPRRALPAWLDSLAHGDRGARRSPRPARRAPPRPRRWLRWLLVTLAVVIGLYAALPYILIGTVRHWLPLDAGGGAVIEDIRTYASAEPMNAAIFVRPGRAGALIKQAVPRLWLPPWLLRAGQSASGLLAAASDDGVMKLSWRLVISGGEPRPTVVVKLTTAQAAMLLVPYTDVDFGGASVSCAIERAQLTLVDRVDGEAPEWRLRLISSGHLRFSIGGGASDVPVSKLSALLRLRFTRIPAGWSLSATIAIEEIETDAADAPMISTPATRRQLEGVVNTELKRRLADEILPAWFPTDAVISGEISPEALKP